MTTVSYKFDGMRKPQEFVVYPNSTGSNPNLITVQSDKSIGQFDKTTGKGVLNRKGSNAKYFLHLSPVLGAVPFQFPQDFINACCGAQLQKGDLIGVSEIAGAIYVG